jgi:hypothetical protein
MQEVSEQIRNQIAQRLAQQQSTEAGRSSPASTSTPARKIPSINLNLPPWGFPAILISLILCGSGLFATQMILAHDPELEKQKALTDSLERQQESLAVVASEATKNAGMKINLDGCLGWCPARKQDGQGQNAGPASVEPQPSATPPSEPRTDLPEYYDAPPSSPPVSPAPGLPAPAPAATAATTNASVMFDGALYQHWFEYYKGQAQANPQGFLIASQGVIKSDFPTTEQQQAFYDALASISQSY